jgi:ubiquinone/menaquinone biosynthesis C-methylase UbiE
VRSLLKGCTVQTVRDREHISTSTNLKKYQSRNVLRRLIIKRFNRQVAGVIERLKPQGVLDAGCGHGFVMSFLSECSPSVEFCGLDFSLGALNYAHRIVPATSLVCGDVTQLPFRDDSFDLVMCFGVLPYLREPRLALQEFGRVTRGHVLLAVANEPWFRLASVLSLTHLADLGNPGFLHHWSRRSFIELVSQELEVVSVMAPFPWTLVLARAALRP